MIAFINQQSASTNNWMFFLALVAAAVMTIITVVKAIHSNAVPLHELLLDAFLVFVAIGLWFL
jgi:hypothetical protein